MDHRAELGHYRRPHWPGVVFGIVTALLIGAAGYWLGMRQQSTPTELADIEPIIDTPISAEPIAVDVTATPAPAASATLADGVTWYPEPKAVSTASLFIPPPADVDPTEFPSDYNLTSYTVDALGEYQGQRILMVGLSANFPVFRDPLPLLLLEGPNETYSVLLKHSPDFASAQSEGKYIGPELESRVTVDSTTEFASIAHQPTLSVGSEQLVSFGDAPFTFSALDVSTSNGLTEETTTPSGVLYRDRYDTDDTDGHAVVLERFVLKRPNHLGQVYQYQPTFLTDDNVVAASWDDGTKTQAIYRLDGAASCGSVDSYAVLASGSLSGWVKAGKTAGTGETLYVPDSTANPILKTYYEITGGTSYRVNEAGEGEEVSFTIDEYLANRGIVAYQDPFDRVMLLMNTDYGPNAECGKPVVYLYPERTTDVSVQVGADVTVSEPTYGEGWTVRAEPNGTLTTPDGQSYDSLFWEGTGHGAYPAITSGFVVAQAELEPTLRDHLSRLGLNEKESADFLEFWLPRMPDDPYTRLTWFGTRQMDQLAPLTVSPQPDTSIRIFLDFAGLQEPIDLPPQRLSAPERKDFTLVEWGGLLRK